MKKRRGKKRGSIKSKKKKQKVMRTFIFALAILAILVSLLSIFIAANNLKADSNSQTYGKVSLQVTRPTTGQVGVEILPQEDSLKNNENGNLK